MEEIDFLIAGMMQDSKRVLGDIIMDRSVCVRKVLIEKHLPKYIEKDTIATEIDKQYLVTMGTILTIGDIIGISSRTKTERKNEKVSTWDIAQFTVKHWLLGITSKWKAKKKH